MSLADGATEESSSTLITTKNPTDWAIVLVTAIGTGALSVQAPVIAVGALFGVIFVAGSAQLSDSLSQTTITAMALPVLSLGMAAFLWETGLREGFAPFVLGSILGAGAAATVTEASEDVRGRLYHASIPSVLLLGGIVPTVWGILGGFTLFADVSSSLFAFGTVLVFGGVSLIAVVASVPMAAVSTPQTSETASETQDRLIKLLGGSLLGAVILLWLVSIVTSGLPSLLAPVLTASVTVGYFFGILCLCLILVNVVVGIAWSSSKEESHVVGILAGALTGICLPAAVLYLSGVDSVIILLLSLFAAIIAIVLGAVALASVGEDWYPTPSTAITGAFGVATVLQILHRDPATGMTVPGLLVLVSLAAAMFVYNAGRYRRVMEREVGTEAYRFPQYVWLGWNGLISLGGLLVALALVGVGGTLPTFFSPPARLGVAGAVFALLAATYLLLR